MHFEKGKIIPEAHNESQMFAPTCRFGFKKHRSNFTRILLICSIYIWHFEIRTKYIFTKIEYYIGKPALWKYTHTHTFIHTYT